MDQRKLAVKGGILLHDENTVYNLTLERCTGRCSKAVFTLTQSRALVETFQTWRAAAFNTQTSEINWRSVSSGFRTVILRCIL